MSVHKGSEELKKAWDQFSQTVEKPCSCPFCQGRRIYWNGYRERSASVIEGGRVVYLSEVVCRRVKCADRQCKKSWTLRPPGLMPDRHYQMCVVASAARRFLFDPHSTLSSVAAAYQCCRRTVGRWLRWLAGIAKPSALIRRLGGIPSTAVFAARDNKRGIGTPARKVFERAPGGFACSKPWAKPMGTKIAVSEG
jgi:hypothetical protein